jgi:hypothetical protein
MARKKNNKTTTATAASAIRFEVHPSMQEVQDYARRQGWIDKGWTRVSIPWQELVYTTDGWKTQSTLKKPESPSPQANGHFLIPGVPAGTQVEFAIHVGVASQAPSDAAGYRERGDLWLNNGGGNYRQTTA